DGASPLLFDYWDGAEWQPVVIPFSYSYEGQWATVQGRISDPAALSADFKVRLSYRDDVYPDQVEHHVDNFEIICE
ncbi:MAG: hypothetical protein H0V89_11265, partial [Deltaproteobacteria bacterium]|nr:hypothetical protein [Deltaproteobacteria bacterium]